MQAVGSDGRLSLILYCSLEFAEEADVVLEVEAEVLDLPFEHGDALHAHSVGSMPQASSTLGSTMPAPIISSQPVPLQILQPFPPQMLQLMSTSVLGSVKGK